MGRMRNVLSHNGPIGLFTDCKGQQVCPTETSVLGHQHRIPWRGQSLPPKLDTGASVTGCGVVPATAVWGSWKISPRGMWPRLSAGGIHFAHQESSAGKFVLRAGGDAAKSISGKARAWIIIGPSTYTGLVTVSRGNRGPYDRL